VLIGVSGFILPLNPEPKKITEKFFPDPDIEIPTPAFKKERGFTKSSEMMTFLNELIAAHSSLITMNTIGKSQKGLDIPMLTLSKPGSQEDKVRVWIQGGLHGDEPASTEGVLYLMHQLLNDPNMTSLLDRLVVRVIPMANIDGYNAQSRYAANGLDLNRDQTKLMVHESPILKKAFSEFNAHVALDFHEYRAYRRDFAQMSDFGITSRFDAMFLYSGNLNVPQKLREFTKTAFVDKAKSVLDANGRSHHDYITTTKHYGEVHFNQGSTNARSSATSYALTNAISTLVEIRGVALRRTSFKRRVHSTFLIGKSYLQTAFDKAEEVKKVVEEADATHGEVVVQSERTVSRENLKTIDIATCDEIDMEIIMRDALQSKSLLRRARPGAYILEPDQHHVAERLRVLGLEVSQLTKSEQAKVYSYQVTSYKRDAQVYEGVHRQEVETTLDQKNTTIAAGSYVVYMDQPNANLAAEVLEPEAPNSFISFNVIPTGPGQTLPVHRYMSDKKFDK